MDDGLKKRSRRVVIDHRSRLSRLKAAVLGFSIGDAIGAPIEFETDFDPVSDFQPATIKGLAAGQYTDDTQHFLLALDSLLESSGSIDVGDIATRLQRWYSSGTARSIGLTT